MREIAEGVFASVQPRGGWCVSNAGLIVGRGTGGAAVLVDTAATERRAAALAAEVRAVAGDAPRTLVNTHHHGDHHFGNARLAPATVVGHELMREEMLAAGTALRDLWPAVDWGDTPLVPPSVTFRDRLTLYAGQVRVELIHVGPAHTSNDVVAWLPERRVLFAGDVLMSGVTPYILMGSLAGSLAAIERLRELRPEVVVCGHGPVGGPELLDANAGYLHWLRRTAREGADAGLDPLGTARSADLGAFAALVDPERLVGNLHRAFAEHGDAPLGAPVDLRAGFMEMVELHGGLPACHA